MVEQDGREGVRRKGESMSHTTRRGFIECATGLLLSGCASVPNFGFAGKSGKFMDTELGQMIAKGIRDELAMHENMSASEGEAEHAIRDVEAWLDHMKENGYIEKYLVHVSGSGNRTMNVTVTIKPADGECVILDYSVKFES